MTINREYTAKPTRSQTITVSRQNEIQLRELKGFFATIHTQFEKIGLTRLTPLQETTYRWYEEVNQAVRTPHANLAQIVSDKIIPFLLGRLNDPKNRIAENFNQFFPQNLPDLQAFPEFKEVANKRWICQFLDGLKKVRKESGLKDGMTLKIKAWSKSFLKDLSSSADSPSTVRDAYIKKLYPVLVDPFQQPLDEHSRLGSDHHTYGKMSLIYFLSTQPAEVHHKPPLDPTSEKSFTTEPHPVVGRLFTWLKELAVILPGTVELKKLYDGVLKSGKMPPRIPTKQTEALRLEKEKIKLLEREAATQVEQARKNVRHEEVTKKTKELVDPLMNQAKDIQQKHRNRMAECEKNMRDLFDPLQKQGEVYLKKIEELKPEVSALEENVQELREETHQNEKEIGELGNEVKDFKKKEKRRDEKFLKKIGEAALLSLAAAGGTWAVCHVLQTNSVAVLPTPNGLQILGKY